MRRIRQFRPSTGMLVALLALVLAAAGSATAASLITSKQIANGTIQRADLSSKFLDSIAGWFAKVDAGGNLLAGRHVTKVTHNGPGEFLVEFNRSVQQCAPVATIRGTADAPFYGFVTTYTPGGNLVRVVVRDPQGTPADGQGFNLVTAC